MDQSHYNVKSLQETATIRIQDVSPTAAFTNLSNVTSNFLEGTSGDYGILVRDLNPNHGVTIDVQVGGSSSSQLGLASANGDYYFEWIVGETTETITTVDDDGQIHLALPVGVSSGILRVKANLDDYYEPTETAPITLNILTTSTYRAAPLAQKSFCIEDRVWANFQIVSNSNGEFLQDKASWAIAIPNWSLFDPDNDYEEYSSYEQNINGVMTTVTCTNAAECNGHNRILYVNNGTYYGRWHYTPDPDPEGNPQDGIVRNIANDSQTQSHDVRLYSRGVVLGILNYTNQLEKKDEDEGLYVYPIYHAVDTLQRALDAATIAGLSLTPTGFEGTVTAESLDSWITTHEIGCGLCHND